MIWTAFLGKKYFNLFEKQAYKKKRSFCETGIQISKKEETCLLLRYWIEMKEEIVMDQHLGIVINWWLLFRTKERISHEYTWSVVNALCLPLLLGHVQCHFIDTQFLIQIRPSTITWWKWQEKEERETLVVRYTLFCFVKIWNSWSE